MHVRPAQSTNHALSSTSSLLRRGARGEAVAQLQRQLAAHGFDPGRIDGDFGPRTEQAVRAFQRTRHLSVDGVVGPATRAALSQPARTSEPPPPAVTGGAGHPTETVLREGSRSPAVRYLQTMLTRHGFDPGSVDGTFGPRTEDAVRRFQAAHGLAADGVVGPATWRTLTTHPTGHAHDAAPVGAPALGSNGEKLEYAKRVARELGLTITSTTGGRHAPGSYHYRGRAIDVAGAPSAMAAFYRRMEPLRPTELFYDPIGGIKYGRNIGPIGGHRDHVHVAF